MSKNLFQTVLGPLSQKPAPKNPLPPSSHLLQLRDRVKDASAMLESPGLSSGTQAQLDKMRTHYLHERTLRTAAFLKEHGEFGDGLSIDGKSLDVVFEEDNDINQVISGARRVESGAQVALLTVRSVTSSQCADLLVKMKSTRDALPEAHPDRVLLECVFSPAEGAQAQVAEWSQHQKDLLKPAVRHGKAAAHKAQRTADALTQGAAARALLHGPAPERLVQPAKKSKKSARSRKTISVKKG